MPNVSGAPRILYVEDSVDLRHLVRYSLRAMGYEVLEAGDGLTGIQMARSEHPDLILMDVDLPGLTGLEATTRLRSQAETCDIPIVVLTADGRPEERERCLAAGCNGFLRKPITAEDLERQVNEFLRGKREAPPGAARAGELIAQHAGALAAHLEEQVTALQKANAALAHISQLKTNFLVLASHELRSPLARVQGYTALLTEDLRSRAPDLAPLLTAIEDSAEHLGRVVERMLLVSEIESDELHLTRAPVDLSALVRAAVDDMAARAAHAGRQLTLVCRSPAEEVSANADVLQVRRAVDELLHNAVRFTPDGGRIEAIVARVPGGVEVAVADNGIGVPLDQQDLIFEAFHIAEDTKYHHSDPMAYLGGGAGLGLAIARRTAAAHGGRLRVESPGRDKIACPGSRFYLVLPE